MIRVCCALGISAMTRVEGWRELIDVLNLDAAGSR